MKLYQELTEKNKHKRYIFAGCLDDAKKILGLDDVKLSLVVGLFPKLLFYFRRLLPSNRVGKNLSAVVMQQLLSMLKSGISINQVASIIQRDYENIAIQLQFSNLSYSLLSGREIGLAIEKTLIFLPKKFRLLMRDVDNSKQLIDLLEHAHGIFHRATLSRGRMITTLAILLPILIAECVWFVLEVNLYGKQWLVAFEYVKGVSTPFLVNSFVYVFTIHPLNIFILCISIAAAFVLVKLLFRLSGLRLFMSRFFLAFPLFGSILRVPIAYNFVFTVSTYMRFGYDIYQAIKRTEPTLLNSYASQQTRAMLLALENGVPFEQAFAELHFFSTVERSSFLTVLTTHSIADGMAALQSMLAERHKLMMNWLEFLFRALLLLVIILLGMWYVAVDFILRINF